MPDGSSFFNLRKSETRPAKRIILTGAPPIAQQLANQVRCASGMTYGRATATGAKLFPAFTSSRGAPPVKLAEVMPDLTSGLSATAMKLYRWLVAYAPGHDTLPPRHEIVSQFSHMYLPRLRELAAVGLIELWIATGNTQRPFAVRINGKVLATPDANPTYIRF